MSPYRPAPGRARPTLLVSAILLALAALLGTAPAAMALKAPWIEEEIYYLKLLNCTRTGGWVLEDGKCDKYGSGHYSTYREPFTRHRGVSRLVARPYARLMAQEQEIGHELDGTLLERLRRNGFEPEAYGENLAWAGLKPRPAVRWAQRYFQNEKSYDGPHWRQLKDPAFETVGIGVWRKDGRTYLTVDFYTPAEQ